MTLLLAALAFSDARVDYETLAKPLSEVLVDLAPMVGKRVVCDDVLAEDRLVVRVTDVDPRELLAKVAESVAGRVEERDGLIRILADQEYEARLVARRREKLAAAHERWRSDVATPGRVSGGQIDLRPLAEFLSVERLSQVQPQRTVRFSRPLVAGDEPLPSTVPDYHKQLKISNMSFVGTQVTLSANATTVNVTVALRRPEGLQQAVYIKSFPISDQSAFAQTEFQRTPELAKRLDVANLAYRERFGNSTASLTDGFEIFAGRPWQDEPLNALAAPFLLEAAKALDCDLVAHLADSSVMPSQSARPNALMFLPFSLIVEDGGWVVAMPGNVRLARETRTNRVRLREYMSRVQARGTFDFWEYAEYALEPRALSRQALRLEAIGVGPIALVVLSSFGGEGAAYSFIELQKDSRVWASLMRRETVPVSALSRAARTWIERLLVGIDKVQLTTQTTQRDGTRVVTTSDTKQVRVADIGLGRGLPNTTSVGMSSSASPVVICVNETRKYLVSCTVDELAQSVAFSEAGRGDERMHAFYAADTVVPCMMRVYSLKIQLDESRSINSSVNVYFIELPHGTRTFARDSLPESHKQAYERALLSARRQIGR